MYLFKFSFAECVFAKYIFFLLEKKFDICLTIVDFPVPAEPYIKATLEEAKSFLNALSFSSESILFPVSCTHCSNEST